MIRTWLHKRLAEIFSPRGMLVRAAVLALIYLACHLAGWRDHTSILSGTAPAGEMSRFSSLFIVFGGFYVIIYFLFVVAVPILVIAALLMALLERLGRPATKSTDGGRSE